AIMSELRPTILASTNGNNTPRSEARHRLYRYGSAVAAIALATLVRIWLQSLVGTRYPFVTFFVAAMFTARYAGLGPGLLSLALATLSSAWFFIPPVHSLAIRDVADLTGLGIFLFVGLTHTFLCESLRVAERRAERSAADAISKQRE